MIAEKKLQDENARDAGNQLHGLSTGQCYLLLAIGVLFWFGGAMAVRFLTPLGFFGPTASVLAFVVAAPVSWLGVVIACKAARLRHDQVLPGIAVGAASATFCDGIALTWFRWLYGADPEQVLYGAAWILWGIFTFFAAAIFEANRQRAAHHRLSN